MGEKKEYYSDFKVNAVKLSYERKNLTIEEYWNEYMQKINKLSNVA